MNDFMMSVVLLSMKKYLFSFFLLQLLLNGIKSGQRWRSDGDGLCMLVISFQTVSCVKVTS